VKTFIRVVEVWVPSADGTLLEFGSGLYGHARGFGAISQHMVFGRGEGLPGRAWESGQPIILKRLADSYFLRARAAAAEGLTCAIALPQFQREQLKSVLLIFCGDDALHAGAIELWHNEPSRSPDMTLAEGYYGGAAEVFAFMSKHTSFRKGFGLPGLAWESGLPVFMPDLGKGSRFLRGDSAMKVGINRGLAIPCSTTGRDSFVMAFLSALDTPIARRIETWLPDPELRYLLRDNGFCEAQGELGRAGLGERVERGQGALGCALASGVPVINELAPDEPGPAGAAARAAGLGALVALPLWRGDRVVAVVAWYF
jgi:hypothetical protein